MNPGFNPLSLTSGLSFTRILGSISKTIGIIRNVAPLYQNVKPLISKAPELLNRIKSLRENINTIKSPTTNYMQEPPKIVNNNAQNGPNFFQ